VAAVKQIIDPGAIGCLVPMDEAPPWRCQKESIIARSLLYPTLFVVRFVSA
jgi:hypothetical protein